MKSVQAMFSKHRVLVVSMGVLFFYSATLTFATTYVTPGTILDPAGLPGAYTVGPVLSYGSEITSGHDNEVLYLNASNELVSDDGFTRDSSQETVIGKESGTQTYGFFLNNDFGLGGLEASLIGMDSADDSFGLVGVVDATLSGGGPQSPLMTYIADLTDPNNSMSAVTLGNDGGGNSIFALETTNVNANTHFYSNNTGNEIVWDADVTDDLSSQILQSDDFMGLGIKGTAILHGDSSTPNSAITHWGDISSVYAISGFAISSFVTDSTGNKHARHYLTSDSTYGITSEYNDTNAETLASHVMNQTGNTLIWDADTGNDIMDTIVQGQSLATIFKGTMIQHKDAVTGENASILAVDGTAGGLRPFIAGLSYTNAALPTKIVQVLVDDEKVRSRYFDNALDVEAELYQDGEGNTLTWDADTGDDIVTTLSQNQDILGAGVVSGTFLTWEDTTSNLRTVMGVGDATGAGLRPGTVFMSASNTIGSEESAISFLTTGSGIGEWFASGTDLDTDATFRANSSEGNSIVWDENINDDIIDEIQMNGDVGGFGVLDGIGILRTDTNLGVNTGLFAGDASGLGLATMTSYISAGSLLAGVDQNKFFAGDILAMGNGTMMQVNDSNQKIKFNTGGEFIVVNSLDEGLLSIDAALRLFKFGDVDAGGNSTLLNLDDSLGLITLGTGSDTSLSLDGSLKLVTLETGTNTALSLDDSLKLVSLSTGTDTAVTLDDSLKLVRLETGTTTTVSLDDSLKLIRLDTGVDTSIAIDDSLALITLNADSGLVVDDNNGHTCTVDPNGGTCTSDERLKTNIVDIAPVLDSIGSIRSVTYSWNSGRDMTTTHIGFLAQNVQSIFPELVEEGRNGYLGVNYAGFAPILVQAIKELNIKIDSVVQLTEESGIRGSLRTWLADTANDITEIFAGRVKTNELCVGSVCVTESQFLQMVQQSGQSSGSSSNQNSSGDSESGTDGNTVSDQPSDSGDDVSDEGATQTDPPPETTDNGEETS